MAGTEETKVKTVKDRQAQIQANMVQLLNLPSAYTVWEPIKMNWHISKSTRVLDVGEIEMNHMSGKYAKSDMHVLKAVHALGYATKANILALLQYWRKTDEAEANATGRPRLNIPNLSDKELWLRIMELCRYGVLVRHEFWPSDEIRKETDTARSVFNVSNNGAHMYKTILSDSTLSFDQRLFYMNEEDVFRYVLTDMAATSFLSSQYASSARFSVSVYANKRRCNVLAEMKMSLAGRSWDDDSKCRLIFEGVTFRTNPAVVTYEARYKIVENRVRELWSVVQLYREESPVYVIFCLEDGFGMRDLLNIIRDNAPELYSCSLYTTGTVLEYNRVFSHPECIRDCYLEYSSSGAGRLIGAVGYYFLERDIGGR